MPRDRATPNERLRFEGPHWVESAIEQELQADGSVSVHLMLDEASGGLLVLRVSRTSDGVSLIPEVGAVESTSGDIGFCVPLDRLALPGESVIVHYDYRSIPVEAWLTRGDGRTKLSLSAPRVMVANDSVPDVLVDPTQKYQPIEGFGAALTESSAYLIATSPHRDEIMRRLFSREANGIGLSYVRIPLGASDFALDWFTYDDEGLNEDLSSFSIDRDRMYVIPLLKEALRINPDLKIMGSPWSAPGWMKTENSGPKGLLGGRLQDDMNEVFARYLIRILRAYRDEGLELHTLSLQNEPLYDSAPYPSMFMSPNRQIDIIERMRPLFDEYDLSTGIVVYDHNWDRLDYVQQVYDGLSESAYALTVGSAWHAYAGRPESQTTVHDAYPDKGIYFTEITGGSWDVQFASILDWNMRNILIGSVRNWARNVLLWNLALNETGGPSLRLDADDVHLRGVLEVTPDDFSLSPEFYILGHLSKFVLPGAFRIASTNGQDVLSVAFQNPNGSMVALVHNPDPTEIHSFTVGVGSSSFEYQLQPRSCATFIWTDPL